MAQKLSFFDKNSLSIVLIMLMLIFWIMQFFMGFQTHNNDRVEEGRDRLTMIEYLSSGHFIQATFENWESEFLQMAFYVLLTVHLRQKGSSESKSLTKKEPVDREPKVHPKAPFPVKKGGIYLKIYKNSLSIAFALLFLISFLLHFYGSFIDFNESQQMKYLPSESFSEYILNSRFWFESFQNWQSEFLAVVSIVLLSIWLRQHGSPESKPVDAAYDADAE